MSNKTIVAVYGTLLSGQSNHRLLEVSQYEQGEVRFLGAATSKFFGTMYSNGGFPILSLLEPEHKIKVELYQVGEKALSELDFLEGYPTWYNRTVKSFLTENGETAKAWIYHQDKDFNLQIVPNGDWKAFKGVRV